MDPRPSGTVPCFWKGAWRDEERRGETGRDEERRGETGRGARKRGPGSSGSRAKRRRATAARLCTKQSTGGAGGEAVGGWLTAEVGSAAVHNRKQHEHRHGSPHFPLRFASAQPIDARARTRGGRIERRGTVAAERAALPCKDVSSGAPRSNRSTPAERTLLPRHCAAGQCGTVRFWFSGGGAATVCAC